MLQYLMGPLLFEMAYGIAMDTICTLRAVTRPATPRVIVVAPTLHSFVAYCSVFPLTPIGLTNLNPADPQPVVATHGFARADS